MADRSETTAAPTASPLGLTDELLRAVPRLVERTVHQAELARSLAGHLPCIGSILVPRRVSTDGTDTTEGIDNGRRAPEPVRVQDLFDDDGDAAPVDDATTSAAAAATVSAATGAPSTAAAVSDEPAAAAGVPSESELPVADYDSLAASQVVPRLATLDPDDLRAVQRYEAAHRRRQTILNRVAQLLEA
jgi:hypothetical protein